MGYGDAYVYACIISKEVADDMEPVLEQIRDGFRFCWMNRKKNGNIHERVNRWKEIKALRKVMYEKARTNIELLHIMDDSACASDEMCDKWFMLGNCQYEMYPVSWFLIVHGNLFWWCHEDLKALADKHMLILPSHYGIDREFQDWFVKCTERDERKAQEQYLDKLACEQYEKNRQPPVIA